MNKKIFFTDENGDAYPKWEDKTLGEVAKMYQPKTLGKTELAGGLYSVYGATGVIGLHNKYNHEQKQVVVSCRGNCGTVHMTKPLSWINGNAMVINVDESTLVDKHFLLYALGTFDFSKITTGSGQPQIVRSDMNGVQIPLPSLPEQQKIAEFFSALDERIALTADKVKLLKEQKTGYLQKIFAQEIAFTDENGDQYPEWEQKKLGEVADYNRKERKFDDEFFYIDLESVSHGKITMKEKISKVSAPSRAQRILADQDVLFQNVRPYQNNHLLFNASGWESQVVASTGFTQLAVKENLSAGYLLQVFMTKSFSDDVMIRCTGTSYPAINSSELVDISIPFPSLPEQQKIAEFFSALDEQIELTDNKLTLLKEQKKGYLQGIFGVN